MTWREDLQHAINVAHLRTPDPLTCPECGSSIVTVEFRTGIGWIPVSLHFAADIDSACPVLRGGLAAERCYLDLLDALTREGLPLAHYGEPAGTGLIDAELTAL